MVTEQEARDMKAAIEAFEKKDADAQRAIHDAEMLKAQTWYDSIKPKVPTTRDEALTAYKTIKSLTETETDNFRLRILRQKLEEANEKFKELKKNG